MKKIVYVDMDGVLADFVGAAEELEGLEARTKNKAFWFLLYEIELSTVPSTPRLLLVSNVPTLS